MADTPVSADTDDLNAFNDLLNGKAPEAKPDAPAADPVEDATPADDTDGANDDDASAPDAVVEDADADADPRGTEDDGAADDGEPKDEDEDDAENIFKPKKKQTAKERIAEQTRQREEMRRDYEARIAALEAQLKGPAKQDDAPRQPARVEQDADAPHPDAVADDGSLVYPLGEYDPQFLADRTEYLVNKQLAAARAEDAQRAEQTAREREDEIRTTAWEGKLAKSEAEIEDLRPTIQTLDGHFRNLDPVYGTYLAQTIMDMDLGPEVLYYLANNTDEADAIVASGPQKATLALGKLEARIQTALAKKAAPPRSTNAPKPPAVTRGNGGAASVRADTDDLEAFERQLFKKK